ncbi:unnamed protein product [Trifolium pratense]|uniref:Uncharacterized protein n=1 Tax=Trifolium pratense TaxID=57577 RepID=A0ACB0KEC2_TRIPR|nr:unnamed protein product [Trifolium pratense]
MSTCSLQQIYENPPMHAGSPTTLIDQSLESWKNQIKPIQHSSSFTEIFGELYFNEITPQHSPSPSPSASYSSFPELINHLNPIPIKPLEVENKNSLSCKRNLSLRLERLNICNESIDLLENSDKVEHDLENKDGEENKDEEEGDDDDDEEDKDKDEEEGEKDPRLEGKWLWKSGRSKRVVNEYPPPISCIGRGGKLCVSFQAYRNNGRFILKQIPSQDFLHAHRQDGRLTLHLVKHDAEEQGFFDDDDEEDYDSCEKSKIEEEENCDGGVEKERLMVTNK